MPEPGSWRFRWRGPIAAVLVVPCGALAIFSSPLLEPGSWPALGCDIAAWACFLAGALVRFWATLYIGGRKDTELVTAGPYSVCRHPLYLGSLLLGGSIGLFLHSAVSTLGLAAAAAAYLVVTIPFEERALADRFGDSYVEYCRRTPRVWPRPSLYHAAPSQVVLLEGLRRELARATRWGLLPLAGAVLRQLQSLPGWPRLLSLP